MGSAVRGLSFMIYRSWFLVSALGSRFMISGAGSYPSSPIPPAGKALFGAEEPSTRTFQIDHSDLKIDYEAHQFGYKANSQSKMK